MPRVALPASATQARAKLEHLAARDHEDFAALSRLIDRPPSYLGRYVRKGTPKHLRQEEAETLARYFRVRPWELGAMPR
jgi:hypothetical protein